MLPCLTNYILIKLSQELIKELHEILFEEKYNQKRFEDIVQSILEDIQKYTRDYKKLELDFKTYNFIFSLYV